MRIILIALALIAGSAAQAAPRYGVTVLELPGGGLMQAGGINASGDIVGGTFAGDPQALLRRADGSFAELGGLGGTRSFANAISNNGTIALQARTGATGETSLPAVVFPGEAITPIALPAGGNSGQAFDVNDSGVVVGVYRAFSGSSSARAFRWTSDGGFETLGGGPAGSSSRASAVNASGDVVGNILDAGVVSAVRWSADGTVTILDTVGASDAVFSFEDGVDINDAGFMLGDFSSQNEQEYRDGVVIWSPDGSVFRTGRVAGSLFTVARAINNLDIAVGSAFFEGPPGQEIGWIWRPGEGLVDLNTLIDAPGITIVEAFDINDCGQILAVAARGDSFINVLLDPLGAAPVPEPQSWALMILGFGAAGGAMRRARRAAPVPRTA